MKTELQDRRLKAGLTLRELSSALGPGFSTWRLSVAERALVKISAHEERMILAAIERLGPLCADRRHIRAVAREIDFAPTLADLRESRSAHA